MSDEIALHHAVSAFLTHEAVLLDDANFSAWLDLFEEDGIYWLPSSRDQTDMQGQISIMLEDKPLLALRTTRLAHPHAHSVTPHPTTTHLVGNISVAVEGDIVIAHSKLMMSELREDRETRLSGAVCHHLRRRGDGFGILLKRVDLIQAGNTFSAISIPP
jgi:benzoate/toluate 1,2-dioxygenase subunit beta